MGGVRGDVHVRQGDSWEWGKDSLKETSRVWGGRPNGGGGGVFSTQRVHF